ncbi:MULTISPECIES: zinc ABC transporter permease subunit ZnuB [unclassified Hahella]|uniref:zinc ABC transporter permease subunit ZnuB n=1 Tax=unclassified Hahella TaxID=2624107 RepID=UPI001C1E9456|nr:MULTISPECIES: zinc ABC transporter permease subunit ZnuB [unclassified Hahella]MBU6954173.1 zinc ABC transporter permease subunit ZnuB [Hahella sp. HN01]MDG9668739.1 zinc ABC transporter permease subunit ZnuB [Hahella sp. CR1]
MFDILIPALLGGIGLAFITGPLGCFVVWRRMSYFGDTLSHSALMGVALGLMLEVNVSLAITAGCVLMGLTLALMQRQKHIATDTLLGILAHSSLSLGLVALSFMRDQQVDLMSYLFGDLLALNYQDVIWIFAGAVAAIIMLKLLWRSLLMMTLNEDLAAVEGYNVLRTQLLLMLMMSLVIALAMKVVGVLLVTSLLIIPAAAARPFSDTPEKMAALAIASGVFAVVAGLSLSWWWDTPAGPSVVVAAFVLFLSSMGAHRLRHA